eukprot:12410203-Karenia_brevis.AAC.1
MGCMQDSFGESLECLVRYDVCVESLQFANLCSGRGASFVYAAFETTIAPFRKSAAFNGRWADGT